MVLVFFPEPDGGGVIALKRKAGRPIFCHCPNVLAGIKEIQSAHLADVLRYRPKLMIGY
jgi:hypothetical protein